MTPTEKIDAALDSVLAWLYPPIRTINKEEMREAMRKIMAESYLAGSNDARKAASDDIEWTVIR